ncbi:alpha/beta hydrolase [Frigoribacterium sp. CFBP 13729]|uniref:alpha/beta hydrolase n=1 Tax=Frigoribacterium sp. CFBP 13729 TaxID=2775293 RepID=UPI00177CFC2E|nr:alpha/beta family hydrolase [Frigoribacterium sp. CFBP 13729]MBD8609571.1 alpha/beta hydrolase [Frigoribacterium sp. CFBP 13729]
MTLPSASASPVDVRGGVELPARRSDVELRTADGLTLVGELALPLDRDPVAALVTLHPLPTAGGFMDSHVIRKAAARLPALADVAVLRFNFRGVSSPRGRSEGAFGEGEAEAADLRAAVALVQGAGLPTPWLLGWSFGTEVALKHGRGVDVAGLLLLSPPLHRTTDAELAAWNDSEVPIVAVVPEHDDYLQPEEARARFAAVPRAEVVAVEGGKHLWVGEKQTSRVLDEIVRRVAPGALPLPTTWPPSEGEQGVS